MSTESTSDDQLIEAAQAGDAAAFDVLVSLPGTDLPLSGARACHHPDDAKEVAVAAFGRAYDKQEQFERRSSFVSWLGRIATNLCFRRREKKELKTAPLDESHEPPDEDSPERQAVRQEMHRIIRAAVTALPEHDQSVLRLRDIEELSAAETALKTGLNERHCHLTLPFPIRRNGQSDMIRAAGRLSFSGEGIRTDRIPGLGHGTAQLLGPTARPPIVI